MADREKPERIARSLIFSAVAGSVPQCPTLDRVVARRPSLRWRSAMSAKARNA
jgi:hypothetical protein